MHIIKKYANRKLYDTKEKRYLTMDHLAEMIKAGREVSVIDNETGKELTSSIVSRLLARETEDKDKAVPTNVLIQMLRKGRGTLVGYGKRYVSLWQGALTLSREEMDKLINSLVRDKELSESEGRSLKKEIIHFTHNLKSWILETIDHRVAEVLKMMNLATTDHLSALTKELESLKRKVKDLEKRV